MQPDDVMPNDGTYFLPREPEDQAIARKSEKARTLEAQPVLEDLLKWFDKRIKFYGSIDSIPARDKQSPEKFLIAVRANEIAQKNLKDERGYLQSLLDTHTKR